MSPRWVPFRLNGTQSILNVEPAAAWGECGTHHRIHQKVSVINSPLTKELVFLLLFGFGVAFRLGNLGV
jgi:hypothetical protein